LVDLVEMGLEDVEEVQMDMVEAEPLLFRQTLVRLPTPKDDG
jgi:hypothetical protein